MSLTKEIENVLRGPRCKIERAEHHILDLNNKISEFLSKKPFILTIRDDGYANERIVFIKEKIAVPLPFAVILGDAVHNLRSALDLVMFKIIGEKVKDPEQVQFPFSTSPDALVKTIQRRQIDVAGKNVVSAIKELKPYPGGNELLNGLHALNITDKHRLIIPIATSAEMSGNDFGVVVGVDTKGVNIRLHQETRLVVKPKHPNALPRNVRRANRSNLIREYEYNPWTCPDLVERLSLFDGHCGLE